MVEGVRRIEKLFKTCLGSAALAGLVAVSSIAMKAQDTNSQRLDTGTSKMMKSADTAFALKAAQGGAGEVQLGKLAAQKANNPDVKAFGQQMVDDHTKANNNLMSVAQAENMTLPTSLNGKDSAEYTKLLGLSGANFDREYVKHMVKDHELDVKEFQKEANNGKDPQIKDFASQTLPTLQEHLTKAKSLESTVMPGRSSK